MSKVLRYTIYIWRNDQQIDYLKYKNYKGFDVYIPLGDFEALFKKETNVNTLLKFASKKETSDDEEFIFKLADDYYCEYGMYYPYFSVNVFDSKLQKFIY